MKSILSVCVVVALLPAGMYCSQLSSVMRMPACFCMGKVTRCDGCRAGGALPHLAGCTLPMAEFEASARRVKPVRWMAAFGKGAAVKAAFSTARSGALCREQPVCLSKVGQRLCQGCSTP